MPVVPGTDATAGTDEEPDEIGLPNGPGVAPGPRTRPSTRPIHRVPVSRRLLQRRREQIFLASENIVLI
jgi:hypothetical protein